MSGNPRPATFGQILTLNKIRALKLVEPGDGENISFDDAHPVLSDAFDRGLWTPQPRRKKKVPRIGVEREGWDSPPEAA